MPPNSGIPQAGPTPEQALSSLLLSEQLTELVVLISSITDAMRRKITETFDATEDSNILRRRERLARDGNNPNLNEWSGSGQEETEAEARARRLQANRERQLPEPGLQDLENDAVEYFQAWRDGLVSRIVDALNAKGEDVTVSGGGAEKPPDYNVLGTQPTTITRATFVSSSSLFSHLYPPTPTPLSLIPEEKRTALLSTFLLLLLSQGSYSSHSRILLLYLTSSLSLPLSTLHDQETTLARGLLAVSAQMSASAEAAKRNQESASSRRWKIGLAGLAGAVAIGVTGGLAAPLVAGAIGTVMGGLGLGTTVAAGVLGTLGGSTVVMGGLFGAYGYGMGGRMMEKYAREVEDFAFLEMRKWKRRGVQGGGDLARGEGEERRLRVTVGVSGWLGEQKDVLRPWRVFGTQNEVFALRWELQALLDMGKSLESMVSSVMWTVATREIIMRTAFASLMFAMWPIALTGIVDSPFRVAKSRADKAGLVLADALINKAQGERPITLIGYSMGARLIYSCLMSLAERRAFGLVESAVLIGTPAPSDASVWRAIRSVVAGRLVNIYSEKDFVLAYLYRTSSIQLGVAGLEEVGDVKGVENVDVTAIVAGHLRYPRLIGTILENIGWEDINTQEVERERLVIKMLDEEEDKKIAEQLEANSSTQAQGMTPKTDSTALSGAPWEEALNSDTRPRLPSRTIVRNRTATVQAENDLLKTATTRRLTGNPIEDTLSKELTKYIEEVSENKFRCHVPDCQKFFKDESFWRIHVEKRHTEWFEAIKETVRLEVLERERPPPPAYETAVRGEEPGATPNVWKQEDDLISFDNVVEQKILRDEKPTGISESNRTLLDGGEDDHTLQASQQKVQNPVLPESRRQMTVRDISNDRPLQPEVSKDERPTMPARPRQASVRDISAAPPLQELPPMEDESTIPPGHTLSQHNFTGMPNPQPLPSSSPQPTIPSPAQPQPLQRLERPHESTTHHYDREIYDADDSDGESGGIMMVDNEITVLEPEPWTEDEGDETYFHR